MRVNPHNNTGRMKDVCVWGGGGKKGNRKDINQTRTNSTAMREEALRKIKRSRVGAGHKAGN